MVTGNIIGWLSHSANMSILLRYTPSVIPESAPSVIPESPDQSDEIPDICCANSGMTDYKSSGGAGPRHPLSSIKRNVFSRDFRINSCAPHSRRPLSLSTATAMRSVQQ
jgi:hypothetical protein